MEIEEGDSDSDFVTLLDLLGKRVAPGTLATAIEKHGIYGWDRFGRFTRFTEKDGELKSALDVLAAQYDWDCRGFTVDELSPAEHADAYPQEGGPMYFGWKSTELPPLEDIAAAATERRDPLPTVKSGAGGRQKGQNHSLIVIGALLAYIQGRLTAHKHPDFTSLKDLAELLDWEFDKRAGTQGSLQGKFTDALKLFAESIDAVEQSDRNTPR